MTRGFLILLLVLPLSIVAVSNASADSFTFNVDYCSNPCLGGTAASNNGGTVTVTQAATNIVDVVVSLNSLVFHETGGLDAFNFNISGLPSLTQITSGSLANGQLKIINGGGSGWTLVAGGHEDGAGTFGYTLQCTVAPGACSGNPMTLEFQIDVTGLTPSSLETLNSTSNVDFGANVANGSCTGMIGAGNGTGQSSAATTHTDGTACTTAVPEPTTLALVGSGLVSLGVACRRKWLGRKA